MKLLLTVCLAVASLPFLCADLLDVPYDKRLTFRTEGDFSCSIDFSPPTEIVDHTNESHNLFHCLKTVFFSIAEKVCLMEIAPQLIAGMLDTALGEIDSLFSAISKTAGSIASCYEKTTKAGSGYMGESWSTLMDAFYRELVALENAVFDLLSRAEGVIRTSESYAQDPESNLRNVRKKAFDELDKFYRKTRSRMLELVPENSLDESSQLPAPVLALDHALERIWLNRKARMALEDGFEKGMRDLMLANRR